jgi:sugar phosphate isomerase/epimerase
MDTARISTCTYPLRELGFYEAFEILSQAGFENIDLWGRSPHFSITPRQVPPRDIEAACEQFGLRIANIGSYPGKEFASDVRSKRHREMTEMMRTIDLAGRFGARSIRVSPGADEGGEIPHGLRRSFQQAAVYAASHGVYLGMENHAGSIAGDVDLCYQLCERVDSKWFGVLYEPCNLLAGGTDYKEAFDALKEFIVHIHIKDGSWDGGEFHRCHLGEGDIDIPWVVEAMESIGYDGYYALEYEITDIEPIETGLPKWLEYFAAI